MSRDMTARSATLAERVMARADELADCSEDPDRLTRRFLTAPMRTVHDRLTGWLREIGIDARIDNAGNLIGRRVSATGTRALLLGSHLDTVPGAGRYDGVLGVLIGLAVAEALDERSLPFHLDVIGFSEEEGVRFNKPYLGSSAVAGIFQQQWLERIDGNISLREAITSYQLDADHISQAAYAPETVLGFIEPHLEQGPVLEQAGLPVGVVSGISGQVRLRLEFQGHAGHAGTTPMLGRSDALLMAARFVEQVAATGQRTPGLRATVGRIAVTPNAPNVIPGRVELSLDVRHMNDAQCERAVRELLAAGQEIAQDERGSFVVLEQTTHPSVAVDADLTNLLVDALRHCGHEPLLLESGAGHDAVVMAQKFPMSMLFLRHPGGVSHHPDERVEHEDVAVAIEVLVQLILRLAEQTHASSHTEQSHS